MISFVLLLISVIVLIQCVTVYYLVKSMHRQEQIYRFLGVLNQDIKTHILKKDQEYGIFGHVKDPVDIINEDD